MSDRTERVVLTAILVGFAALAIAYSVVVPPFEASDELWHYPMVKTLADNRRLPVQDPANVGPWRQEGSQPPLYYIVGALATAWIDTSDMDEARHLNVHVDNGVATADGNINLVVHDPALESFPWHGTVLAVHIVRLLSVAMSTAAVYLTWRVARAVVPGRQWLALATAAIHAFTPMYVFISGALNNDNLVVPLTSLAMLQLFRLMRDDGRPEEHIREKESTAMQASAREYAALGIILGLAALSKTTSLALTLLTAIVVSARALRRRSWVEFVVGGLATLVPVLLIAGWWYARNWVLYGDLAGLRAFIEILGKRDVPAGVGQLWRERFSFAAGYWGNFGGLNVPLPAWAYDVLNWLAIIAAAGLLTLVARWLTARVRASRWRETSAVRPDRLRAWPFALCLMWGAGVVVPWSQWAATTWSSQGRLIFAAMPVWSLLLALGLSAWFPRRREGWILGSFVAFLVVLATAALLLWIPSAYALPEPLGDEALASIPHRLEVDFRSSRVGGEDSRPVMRLLGYTIAAQEVPPGGSLTVILYWEAIEPTSEDCTVFVHLLGEGELLVAQRDTYPGLGLLSTTRVDPGYRWADQYALRIPETAYSPDVAEIEVGIFVTSTGQRLLAAGPDGEHLGDHIRFARVAVQSHPDEVPNPIAVSFGDGMVLVGYDLDHRIAAPGDEVTLTLYWEARREIRTDYTVSTQFVDDRQRKAAQVDSWPRSGAAPTTTWRPGQPIVDAVRLTVSDDAEPGAYGVRVAVYSLVEGEIRHLPIVPSDGRMLADHIVLTQARVVPR